MTKLGFADTLREKLLSSPCSAKLMRCRSELPENEVNKDSRSERWRFLMTSFEPLDPPMPEEFSYCLASFS